MALAGCGTIPYRVDGFLDEPECQRIYDAYDDISPRNASAPDAAFDSPCWLRAKEEREGYDLLFVVCLPLIRPIGLTPRAPQVFVMQSTDARHLHHPTLARQLHTARLGCVFSQR
jgi:hypothetical protein